MMEAARTSETLVNFYQTTWRYNPEDSHLLVSVDQVCSLYTVPHQEVLLYTLGPENLPDGVVFVQGVPVNF
jgi:hypothetical protein